MYVRLRGMCVLNYFVNSPPHDAEREAELCSMIPIKTVRPKKLSMSSNSPPRVKWGKWIFHFRLMVSLKINDQN